MFHTVRGVALRIWAKLKHTAHKSPDHTSEDVKDKRGSFGCHKLLFKIILQPLHFHFYDDKKKIKGLLGGPIQPQGRGIAWSLEVGSAHSNGLCVILRCGTCCCALECVCFLVLRNHKCFSSYR